MNHIEKMLIKARQRHSCMYFLICFVIPKENGRYDLNMNLHKHSEIIKNFKKSFDTEKKLTKFIDNVSQQYELTENNILIFNIKSGSG